MTIEFSNSDNSLLTPKRIGAILFACNINAVLGNGRSNDQVTYPGKNIS